MNLSSKEIFKRLCKKLKLEPQYAMVMYIEPWEPSCYYRYKGINYKVQYKDIFNIQPNTVERVD